MVRDKPMDAQIYHPFAKRPLANHSSELTKRDAPCFIRTSLSQFEKCLDELKDHHITNTRSPQRYQRIMRNFLSILYDSRRSSHIALSKQPRHLSPKRQQDAGFSRANDWSGQSEILLMNAASRNRASLPFARDRSGNSVLRTHQAVGHPARNDQQRPRLIRQNDRLPDYARGYGAGDIV